jgi:hypothetical protein
MMPEAGLSDKAKAWRRRLPSPRGGKRLIMAAGWRSSVKGILYLLTLAPPSLRAKRSNPCDRICEVDCFVA